MSLTRWARRKDDPERWLVLPGPGDVPGRKARKRSATLSALRCVTNVEGNPVLAVMQVQAIEEVSDEQMQVMTEKVYRTSDPEHPGVAAFNSQGRVCVSGPIEVLNFSYFITDFDTFRTAVGSATKSPSVGGKRLWPSRPATRCIWRTRNSVTWPWIVWAVTAW